ncbi:MAG: hypothetical protein ACE15F_04080 [bacterium]
MVSTFSLFRETCPFTRRNDLTRLFDHLAVLSRSAARLRYRLDSARVDVTELLNSRGMLMIVKKNKWGFNKEEAKKLFYSFRAKNTPEEGDSGSNFDSAPEPETTERKIAMIMVYMKETSAKLDRIEDDIAELKEKVNDILKKI